MAQSVKPISSPIPVTWYPTLSVLMLAVGLVITASFFMFIDFYAHKLAQILPSEEAVLKQIPDLALALNIENK